mmetsp:Transcript_11524/g.15042  ORF Transcript_11524/g.15042 Transcript_11524/m.15042 type:complete len:738 (+) Transcript_11524:88-2301(+)
MYRAYICVRQVGIGQVRLQKNWSKLPWIAKNGKSKRHNMLDHFSSLQASCKSTLVESNSTSNDNSLNEKEHDKETSKGSKVDSQALKRFIQIIKPELPVLGGALAALGVTSASAVAFPWAVGKSVDAITTSMSCEAFLTNLLGDNKNAIETILQVIPADTNPLSLMSYGLLGTFVVGSIATFVRSTLVTYSGERIAARLRKQIFASIIDRELAFFDRNKTGELMSRLTADVSQVSWTLTTETSVLLRNVAQGTGAIGMMVYISPELCGVMLGVIPPVAAWAVFFGRKVKKASKEVMDALADTGSVAEERLSNMHTVRSIGNDFVELARYNSAVDNHFRRSKQQAWLNGIFYSVAMGGGNLGMLAVLWYGGKLVQTGAISVGDLSTVLLYSVYAGVSISAVLSYYGSIMETVGSATRIFQLLEENEKMLQKQLMKHKSVPLRAISDVNIAGPIEFKNVNFAYPSRPHDLVLKDLNLTVERNESLALVGRSGSGKSTIAALVTRLYDPNEGRVLINDIPVGEIPIPHLRSRVAYVNQENVLFPGTVTENLMYGFPDLAESYRNEMHTMENSLQIFPVKESQKTFNTIPMNWNLEERMARIHSACETANCMEFISKWDKGFDTVIGEGSIALSGGQRARIALARSLLRDSNIFLLDEITAALDSESEYHLHAALKKVLYDRTSILIAHRWSSIKIADKIAVLDAGKIVEVGTKQDLLSQTDSAFRHLVQHQLSGTSYGRK